MCELFAMTAERPAIVEYLLDRFAAEGGERHRNRDGWGIVFTEDRDAHVYREAEPASDSALARMVLQREIPTRHLIAHVRRASRGHPSLANTHPFTRVLNGMPHHFAHNGTLVGIEDQAPELGKERVGDTDSELAFLILLRDLNGIPHGPDATRDRFACFSEFAARMKKLGDANFLFFDGETLFAHAHKRIFETSTGLSAPMPPGLCIRDFSREPDVKGWHGPGAKIRDVPTHTILLASVALDRTGWRPLPEGCALALRNGVVIEEQSTN